MRITRLFLGQVEIFPFYRNNVMKKVKWKELWSRDENIVDVFLSPSH